MSAKKAGVNQLAKRGGAYLSMKASKYINIASASMSCNGNRNGDRHLAACQLMQ
jgi:hypothetical protein